MNSVSATSSDTPARPAGLPAWVEAALLAFAGALFVTLIGLQSFGTGIPNADDLVRLVEVRDLLAGQNWFDLTQYWLGLEGGTLMHWSRLVDAPIALIILAAKAFTGETQMAETVAQIVWPALTALLAMAALVAGCIRSGARDIMLPVAVIGAVALWSTGVFGAGALDHHNIQAALSLWLLTLLLPGARPVLAHAAAGIVAVLMIAIGMEVLPYVALAGAVVAFAFIAGAIPAIQARAFGLTAATTTAVVFVTTIAPGNYAYAACDAFSAVHLLAGGLGGLGLALASVFHRSAGQRLAATLLAGAALLGAIALFFPHCLENPLASLDPKLQTFWLDGVVETRSLPELLATDPFAVIGLYGMAVTALIVSAIAAARSGGETRHRALVFAVFLAMGIAVTAWQQRGFVFAAVFAILPLGFWLGGLRAGVSQRASVRSVLAVACAWIVSLNLVWWIAGAQAGELFAQGPTLQQQIAAASPRDHCYGEDLYAPLREEPDGVVLGATDIGSQILLYTDHRAVAGPYHRNSAGNLLLIEAMLAKPETAHDMLRRNGVTHVADCLAAADGVDFIHAAPDGLQSALRGASRPHWLEPIAGTAGSPLVIYRVTN